MAQGWFPPTGSFAVTRPRTLREYRQAIFAGLEGLRNDDLELLLTLHFPEIDHVQDAQRNRNSILVARLPVIEIWTRVSAFLAWSKLPPLDGEAPPGDLFNRSARILIAEVPSSPSAISTPVAESTWSCSEITLPGFLAQPAPREATATIPVASVAGAPSSQPILQQPAATPRPLSWPAFGGWLMAVALIGVHVCPYVKHAVSQARPQQLVSLETSPVATATLPRFTVIPANEPPPSARTHTRHHRQETVAGRSFDLTSGPECRFTRTRLVHGQLKDKIIKKKLPLPHGLKPGSREAQDWLQAACERVQQELSPRR